MSKSPYDWKGKAASHRMNCFRLAAERGPAGVANNEMYARPDLYGRAFRNRMSELAQMGCVFRDARLTNGKSLGHWDNGEYRYILESWPAEFKPLPDYYAQKEIPWDKRPRVATDRQGRPLADVPGLLFAEARR